MGRGWIVGVIALIGLLGGCSQVVHSSLEPVEIDHKFTTVDDLDRASLQAAVRQSLAALRKKQSSTQMAFGGERISVEAIRESLETLLKLIERGENIDAALARDFVLYRVSSPVLFTGYHEPVLRGSLVRTDRYRYPLYRPPHKTNGKAVTSFSRAEIDGQGKLDGRGYELVWLNDPVDRFFLHIQGSGQILLPDGHRLRVGYAGHNGYPYRSIGKTLRDEGKLQEVTTPAIRQYLTTHPDERDAILFRNARYIFFQKLPAGPLGSLGVPLTPGRSLAIDPSIYPLGALGVIRTKRPLLSRQTGQVQWKKFSRIVLFQDTGAAIRGPQRADLFWGSAAEAEAGLMAERGDLYLLMKKP